MTETESVEILKVVDRLWYHGDGLVVKVKLIQTLHGKYHRRYATGNLII